MTTFADADLAVDTTAPAPDVPADPAVRHVRSIARAILDESVRRIVGSDDADPRPGQKAMIEAASTVMDTAAGAGRALAVAPTGAGKSAIYLSAACAAVATRGERSVISTETLALQSQITDKDAPVVAAACEHVTGYRPRVSVLKGFSNFACHLQAMNSCNDILTDHRRKRVDAPGAGAKRLARLLADKGAAMSAAEREKVEAVMWALDQMANDGDGDKATYTGTMTDGRTWEAVSVASGDCVGAENCPFADQCLPRAARERAADADIVITNHTLLALQAANDIPIVIGSNSLGTFDHIFVDEAHGLPASVRARGSAEVSGRSVRAVSRALGRCLDEADPEVDTALQAADVIATMLDDDVADLLTGVKDGGVASLTPGSQEKLASSLGSVEKWIGVSQRLLKRATAATSSPMARLALLRGRNRVNTLASAVRQIAKDEPGWARWAEYAYTARADESKAPVLRCTPVDVSGMLRYSLWTRPMTDEEFAESDTMQQAEADGPEPRVSLSVMALSATLPKGYARESGIDADIVDYPSPFDTAYGASALYVPRAADDADIAALKRPWGTRTAFDTGRHSDWALPQILELVEANGGSALILAATASNGRKYAEALSTAAKGRWKVRSQWDGRSLRNQVSAWKKDVSSVLVGTRSLMTGVDADGPTCSLVVIDRPARVASNPVDDARVAAIVAGTNMDKWAADRLVYVSDAATLLEQAAGRLIRKVTDSGMVAVLDPRLLKAGPFSYPEPTRRIYLDALRRFDTRMSRRSQALEWLAANRDVEEVAS